LHSRFAAKVQIWVTFGAAGQPTSALKTTSLAPLRSSDALAQCLGKDAMDASTNSTVPQATMQTSHFHILQVVFSLRGTEGPEGDGGLSHPYKLFWLQFAGGPEALQGRGLHPKQNFLLLPRGCQGLPRACLEACLIAKYVSPLLQFP